MILLNDITELTFEISSYCNLKCPMCPRYTDMGYIQQRVQDTHLYIDDIIDNMDLKLMPNLRNIILEGDYGDPMMNPKIERYVDVFQEYNITIITNGSIGTTKWWEYIAKYKNLTVVFSIDGMNDTNHIYRIGANYDKIIDNVVAFINGGGIAKWKFIVFKHNEFEIAEAKKYSQELGFSEFMVEHTNRGWDDNGNFEVFDNGEYLYTLSASSHMTKSNAILTNSVNCMMVKNKNLYINCDGHVLPCCMSSGLSKGNDNVLSQMWMSILRTSDDINLHVKSLSCIIRSDFYKNNLLKSFNMEPWIHPICVDNCMVKHNKGNKCQT